jgi:hypothetical protein
MIYNIVCDILGIVSMTALLEYVIYLEVPI